MPHILVQGTDMTKNIQWLQIDANINFSQEYFHTSKAQSKLMELREKMEELIAEYFPDDYESEIFDNHEWNMRNNKF